MASLYNYIIIIYYFIYLLLPLSIEKKKLFLHLQQEVQLYLSPISILVIIRCVHCLS